MSYHGYNYSPYFQQTSENGRNRQSFSAQSQANAPYYRQPQQAMTNSHHYASQQTQYQPPPLSRPDSGAYTEQQYNNSDAAQDGRLHSGGEQQPLGPSHPEVHGYNANMTAYTDTSALGSLAYASGLGAEQTGRSAPARVDSPSTVPNMNPARPQPATTTTRTSAGDQLNTFSASNGHYPSPRSDSRNSGISQSDRRATAQQPYAASSDHQPSEGYDIRPRQAQHQAQTFQRFGNGTTRSGASSDLQPDRSSNTAQPGPQLAKVTSSGSSTRQAEHNDVFQQWMPVTGGHQGHDNRAVNQMHDAGPVHQNLLRSIPATSSAHEDKHSALNAPQYPTTVDPSQVFNHYEYQRRKTAAVSEVLASRRALEAVNVLNEQSNGIQATVTHQPSENPPSRTGGTTVSDEVALASSSERDQIEEEMKTMIERMREYKAKNPTLFSQIWEQVKKGQPPNRASSQAPSSAKEAARVSEAATDKAVETSFEPTENGQLPSPSLTTVQHSSAVESPPELLPDLGRFPAQRRKRYNKRHSQTASSPQLRDAPTKDSTTNVSAQPDFSHHGPPDLVQLDLSKDNLSNANVSEGNTTMRQAMEAFHRASAKANATAETAGPDTPIVKPAVPMRASSSTASGKTIWPENKKMALATAAKIALTSAPVNAGKKISSHEIHQLLDQNPSYTELCEHLEARGFVLDRGHFARLLLSAVPDVNPGTPSHAPSGSFPQNAHRIGSPPETGHHSPLALPAGSSQSEIQAPGAPPSPETLQTHSTSYDPPRRSISLSEGERVQAPQTSATPQTGRVQAIRDSLHPYLSRHDSPRPRGRPRKDGLPPRQQTEARQNGDPATPSVTMKQSLPTQVAVSANAKDLSTFAPGQLSAPTQPSSVEIPATTAHIVTNAHVATNTQASVLKDPPQQPRQSQEHAIVKNAHVSLPTRRLPLPGPSSSGSSTPSGFGVLKLTNTFISQPNIARQSAHASATSTYPLAPASRSTSQHDPPAGLPHSRLPNGNLQVSANPQNGHIILRRSPLVNSAPMYSAPDLVLDNLNTAPPVRDFRPVPSARNKRTGPSPHALRQQNQGETIPKALTKEEMARKRNFSDIVDLTQLSEDDDEQHRAKRPRPGTESEMKRAPSDNIHPHTPALDIGPAKQQVTRNPAVRERLLGNFSAPRSEHTVTTNSNIDLSQFKYASKDQLVQREVLKIAAVIQPMDKKNAMRRSTYNAKTIARDVLIAAGHHPKEKALNWHLLPLEKNFRHVNYGSDLSTFNWDLVDPVQQVISVDTATEDADDEGAVSQTEQGPAVRTPIRRHSTRVALLSGGDNEVVSLDVEPPRLNKGVISRPQGRRPRHSDTGVRSRPGDPWSSGSTDHRKPQGSSSAAKSEDTRRRLPSGAISAFTNTSISYMPAGATPTTSSDHTNVSRIEIGSPSSHTHGSSANRSPIETPIKRRGRPPGSTRSSSSASADEASTSEPKRRGRPLGSKDLTSRKAGTLNSSGHISMPTRPRGSNTTPARPSGLRNAITPSDGIAVVIVTPSRSTNSERKRKDSSREPSRSLKVAPQKKSSPAYKIYKCEWKGCKAELHNLETLRKHVRKLHRTKPNADGIPCLWSKCEKTRRIYDKQTRSKKEVHYPHTFSTPTLWDAHMDKAHLEPTAWALGDGPSARPSDAEASDYLSDTSGRLVTPRALTTGAPDPLHLSSEAGPTRAYHAAHGNRTERERAEAVLAACEARVAAVGPGIDRGGCTMVTAEVRERLVDGAFEVRVVDEGVGDVPELPGEEKRRGR